MIKNNWLEEMFTSEEKHSYKIKDILINTKTAFQKVMLLEMETYKKTLVLDGEVQSTELDEYIYHESIVHPAMLLHPNPKRVLILGGGEGATLREVLKYKSLEEVVMVDIDGEVVDFCRKYLQIFHQGSFDDPRATLVINDAKDYLANHDAKFDVIISDLCCPIEGSPSCFLYTIEFYQILKKHLTEKGVLLVQSGPGDIPGFKVFSSINATLKEVFAKVIPFSSYVPSFIIPWGFNIAVNDASQDILAFSDNIEVFLGEKLIVDNLKYYDSGAHLRMFSMPKHLRNILANEVNIITDKNPCFLFK
ncbi:MAG: methyltransferase domain-containing protein [bacterium]|nr:methyltransferase domain-containing protein [bacterium]